MAQGIYKVSEPIKITYQATGATTGLVDVISKILDETESLDPVDFPDITLTENVDVPGEYLGTFTPDAVGTWRVITNSVIKPGRIVKQYDVISHNVDSIGDAVGVVDGKIDTSESNIRGADDDTLKDISDQIDNIDPSAGAMVG